MSGEHQNGKATGNVARMAQVLRTSELNYRRLFETAQDGIPILDADTERVNDVNLFLIKLPGFSRGEMAGKTVGELSPFKDRVSNQAMLVQLQKDGDASGYNAEVIGQEFLVEEGVNFPTKPFEAHKLAQTLRNRLDRPDVPKPDAARSAPGN